ncbi:MAG: hypothetical protein H6899_00110 [Rhodobacter sp.]|nr:hypothetical protein [Paracoccaceae bacterium]MCC0078375.1 hypothetical protein [Rhodobacter sp.]
MSKGDLTRMIALLDRERAALATVDLPLLERLLPRKAMLLARIEADNGADPRALRRIGDAARRNARLFESLIAGMQDTRALIARVRAGGRGQTYGRNGTRAELDPPTGTLHRRA